MGKSQYEFKVCGEIVLIVFLSQKSRFGPSETLEIGIVKGAELISIARKVFPRERGIES